MPEIGWDKYLQMQRGNSRFRTTVENCHPAPANNRGFFVGARQKTMYLEKYIPGRSHSHSRKIWREQGTRALPHDFDPYTCYCRYCGVPEYAVVAGLMIAWCVSRN